MAILVRCPNSGCKRYQSAKNKRCKCGENLDAAKRAKRVRYSITFRDANGKQKKKSLEKLGLNPFSIQDAQDAQAKIKVQKREKNKFFDLPPEDRAAAYEAAEDRYNVSSGNFFDLSPEERGATYERALGHDIDEY